MRQVALLQWRVSPVRRGSLCRAGWQHRAETTKVFVLRRCSCRGCRPGTEEGVDTAARRFSWLMEDQWRRGRPGARPDRVGRGGEAQVREAGRGEGPGGRGKRRRARGATGREWSLPPPSRSPAPASPGLEVPLHTWGEGGGAERKENKV